MATTATALQQRPIELTLRQSRPDGELKTAHFADERQGWKGYIEWEKYPEKKKEAAAILAQYQFDHVGEACLCQLNLADLSSPVAARVPA